MIKANITRLKEIPKACVYCPYFDSNHFAGEAMCRITNTAVDIYSINVSDHKYSNCPLYEEDDTKNKESCNGCIYSFHAYYPIDCKGCKRMYREDLYKPYYNNTQGDSDEKNNS